MGIERVFLGWDGPMLPAAARWLRDRYGDEARLDLSGVMVVVPGRRGARRLLELLVTEAEGEGLKGEGERLKEEGGRLLFPPRLTTVGAMPELLCDLDEPTAGAWRSMAARVQALREAPGQVLEALVAEEAPGRDDLLAWWDLAGELHALGEDLGAAGLRVSEVPERAAAAAFDLRHQARFEALAALEERYRAILAEAGFIDRHEARLRAVQTGRCRCDGDIVLVAAADLSPLASAVLKAVSASTSVTALVHAPPEHGAGFDELGGLNVGYWEQQRVALRDEQISFVDRVGDQPGEVAAVLAAWSSEAACADMTSEVTVPVDEVTVGLGDEALGGAVERALAMAGVAARFGPGHPVLQSRPATMLAALGRFVTERRLDDFAELLRHPDVEAHVSRHVGGMDMGSEMSMPRAWLTLLDEYASEHLQARLDGNWLGSHQRQRGLKAVWDAVSALLPVEGRERRPVHAWSEPIVEALRQVYGHEELDRHDAQDHALGEALGAIVEVLREQAEELGGGGQAGPVSPLMSTVEEAIGIMLSRLSTARVAEPEGRDAVELAGYLELQLDDAPNLIITSMNEGAVPSTAHVDPLLPDSLRGSLGLADNARRYARDLMMLCAIVRSRPRVALIAARRSAEGEPLTPSRLLLACDEDALVRRVDRFYRDDGGSRSAPTLLVPGERDQFLIPQPLLDEPVLDRLSVTAFRDYLACPYRFYLKHVRKLGGLDDAAVEMDALLFGNLAHDVLQTFGESDCSASTRSAEVAAFLSDTLDEQVRLRFGAVNRTAVRVQVEQLRERLTAFAREQAAWAEQGWRIVRGRVEKQLEAAVDLDGEPFVIVGRVDRIDHHPEHGYRILDYKTGDAGSRPERTHRIRRDGVLTWVDLQLPLYRTLCAPLGITGEVAVGYINLPKKLGDAGLALAEWSEDEFDEALARRDEVIRAVRGRVFWPPAEVPSYADEFAGVCADQSMERETLVALSRKGAR